MKQNIWHIRIKAFREYLRFEKSLSENSIEGYLADVGKLRRYLSGRSPEEVQLEDLRNFLKDLNREEVNQRTQARILSGIRAFYRYLVMEELMEDNPAGLLETPRLPQKLPDVLTVEEVDRLIGAIDLSTAQGQRNKAMLETLYSCGLRVSELVHLRLTDLFFREGFIKVTGKGNKERLVPISKKAIREIELYFQDRSQLEPETPEDRNTLFLNRRGRGLSRVMIFTIIRDLASAAGIRKKVSPHTFRHSFATHMVSAGADLRAVQEMLGHESIQTTEIYTHLDQTYLKDTLLMFHPRA